MSSKNMKGTIHILLIIIVYELTVAIYKVFAPVVIDINILSNLKYYIIY